MLNIDPSFYLIALIGSVVAVIFAWVIVTPDGTRPQRKARPHT